VITYQIKAGTTDVSVVIRIVDSTDGTPETGVVFNTSGIDLEYRREGAASVDITEATLAALTTAHADGGFLHIGNGYYRLDLPDAACATGVAGVLVHGVVTGMVVIGCYIQLLANDLADIFARLGAPAGASMSADIAAIEAQTDDIGAAGAGLTAIPWNAAWDAEVQSECADAIAAAEPIDANVTQWLGSAAATPTVAGVPEVDVTHWLGVAQTEQLSTAEDLGILVETTIATLASQTSFTLTAGSADNDAYNGRLIVVQDASTAAQKCVGEVSDYTGASKTVTLLANPGIFTMAIGDTVRIFATPASGGSGLDAAGVRAAIGLASANLDTQLAAIDDFLDTEIAAILADTNELQTDWANGGRLDNILDARASQTSVDTIDGIVDAILVDTAEIGAAGAGLTALASQASVDAIDNFVDTEVAAIKAKTDQLTFGVTNTVNANITHVIADPVQTDGATDTNWGGAP
jgi:hypothetical protein